MPSISQSVNNAVDRTKEIINPPGGRKPTNGPLVPSPTPGARTPVTQSPSVPAPSVAPGNTYSPATATATGYTPTRARATGYNAREGTVDNSMTVEGRLPGLLSRNNPYMQQATTAGLQQAASRGLLNSSMAVGAAEGARINAALPIAQQDAGTFFEQSLRNQADVNRAREFGAAERNTTSRFNAGEVNRAGEFGATAENEASRFNATSENEAGQFNATSQNEANRTREQMEAEFGLQANSETAANYRANLEVEMREYIANLEASVGDRESFLTFANENNQQFMVQVSEIMNNPDIDPQTKNAMINQLQEVYRANFDLAAAVSDYPIEWETLNVDVRPEPPPRPAIFGSGNAGSPSTSTPRHGQRNDATGEIYNAYTGEWEIEGS